MTHERRDYAGAAPDTTLNGAINNSATSLTLTSGTGFPDGDVGPFFLVIDPGLSTEEKVKATARSGNSVTGMTRGSDDTSAASHSSGATVRHVISKTDIDEANSHYSNTALDHHTQYHNTTRHAAVSHVIGTHLPTPATPTAVEIGTAASAGTTGPAAAEDHIHAFTGGLLGITQYRAGSDGTYTTSSSSFGDVDATNLGVTFTAPTNGKVLVRLVATAYIDGAGDAMEWALREGSSNLANTATRVYFNDTGSDHEFSLLADMYVTGISAGSHTYKWAFRSQTGGIVGIQRGPTRVNTLEVWSAP